MLSALVIGRKGHQAALYLAVGLKPFIYDFERRKGPFSVNQRWVRVEYGGTVLVNNENYRSTGLPELIFGSRIDTDYIS